MKRGSSKATPFLPLVKRVDRPKPGFRATTPVPAKRIDPGSIHEEAFTYYLRLQRLQQYVRKHPEDRLSLSRAARIAGLSEAYFSSFFHRKVGVCFRDWRDYTGVQSAIRLMKERNHSITEIGLGVGFGDLRTFERVFKRHTGLTPRQYKQTVSP